MITIFKKGTKEIRAVIDPDDSSSQKCGIMREDNITLTFENANWYNFQVGDYATIFNNYYQLNTVFPFKKVGFGDFQYTLTLESYMYDLGKTNFLFLNASNQFTEGKFSITGKPIDFINLLIKNLKRRDPSSDWTYGTVIDADYQTIDFDSQKCLEVLQTLATKFNTEYLVEGQTISLYKKQLISGDTLEYGQGQALCSIVRDNQSPASGATNTNIITRLYAYGNNINIGSNYRGGAQYLRMAASLYVEKNVNTYGVFEETIYFDGTNGNANIYPQRTGIVSAVTSPFIFSDADIDFNPDDYEIPGATAQITFNTGQLAGYTFDVDSFDNDTKTFTINQNTKEQTIVVPSDLLQPAIGDTYVIINIEMPLSYVNDAEEQLLLAAQQYIATYGPPSLTFPVDCNQLYFQANGLELKLGYTYRLLDVTTGIDRQIRLTEFQRNLRKPFLYTGLVLADTQPVQSTIVKFYNSL